MSYGQWRDPDWYSDADVRNSPELQEMAIEYVEAYEGSFGPLVDAKVWLREADSNSVMPIGLLRKVVNTMRHDDNVKGRMPLPNFDARFPEKNEIGVVIESCSSTGGHYGPHTWYKDPVRAGKGRHKQRRSCPGVTWPINRQDRITMKVALDQKYQFVRARTGRMIHKVSDYDPAYAWWWPANHAWGWRKAPLLRIRTACKNPSIINDPILLTAQQKRNMVRRKTDPMPLCSYCAEEGK